MTDHTVSYEDGCRFPCACSIGVNHTSDGGIEDLIAYRERDAS